MKSFSFFNVSLVCLLFFSSQMLLAVTYTKSSAGNYSSAAGWTPSYPGTNIGANDIVIINASVVTLDKNLENIKGELRINAGAELNGTKNLKVKDNGKLTVNGTLVADELKLEDDGSMTVSGSVTLNDKFEAKDDATFTITSTGSFEADDIEIEDDATGTNNGTMKANDDFKIKDNATFTNAIGAVLTVVNDLKVKDDSTFTNAGTVNVEDDIEVEDDATLNTTGVINLCAPGNEAENKLEVKDNGALTGTGTFCMCSTNNNNTYTNSGSADITLTINTNCNGPLPVELVNFTATRNKTTNIIKWATASEINNSYFEIQFSENGEYFETIGKIKGAGISNNWINYSFEDFRPDESQGVYYRLKNVDFDGKFEYSEILFVKPSAQNLGSVGQLKVYPTVISVGAELHVEHSVEEIQRVQIISISGQIWEIKTNENGFIYVPLDLPKGINFLVVVTEQNKYTKRIVVQ